MTSNKIARLERLFKDTLREREEHWEHEFHNFNRVSETLKYWLGIAAVDLAAYKFSEIVIKDCPATYQQHLNSMTPVAEMCLKECKDWFTQGVKSNIPNHIAMESLEFELVKMGLKEQ